MSQGFLFSAGGNDLTDGTAIDAQLQTLRLYGALCSVREAWGGALVLACGADAGLAAAAVGVAGGACLVLSDDAAAMKASLRRGEVDFVVNTLDEALRTLKNEVRQKRSLGVACVGGVKAVLAEMVERGVQPELCMVTLGSSKGNVELAMLRQRGAVCVDAALVQVANEKLLRSQGWNESLLPAMGPEALREVEWALAAADGLRARWLRRSGQYLRLTAKDRRWVWMTAEEKMRRG